MSRLFLEIEFYCELNQPRVIARRGDATEVTGIADDLARILINAGGRNSVEIADRIGQVYAIQKIKELRAKFNSL